MKQNKPFSQACENNKDPILSVLSRVFLETTNVLEIGSGTGQHAAYFAPRLTHLCWQPSDQSIHLAGIRQWTDEVAASNLLAPVELNVDDIQLPFDYDGVFSANTAHIMSWSQVEKMFAWVAVGLQAGGVFALYGPFNYQGQFTSDSNARFDAFLKETNAQQGIRDFEALNALAELGGMRLLEDNPLPANNRVLVWQKQTQT